MWYTDDTESRRRTLNRRFDGGRNSILMVSARMSEQKKDRAYRTGAIVLAAVALAGILWAIVFGARLIGESLFSRNDRFQIRTLDISSDGKLTASHIREYAGVSEGMNLFAIDIAKMRKDLESVPVVSSVTIERRLPDTLVIRTTERSAVARLENAQVGYTLALDREGFVLGPSSVSPQLPAITGSREKGLRPGARVGDPAVKNALHLIELCDQPGFSQVVKIERVDVGQSDYLDIRLSRGERILMTPSAIDARLEKLRESVKHAADMGRAIATIDMTVDKNFPVQYQ